MGETYLNFIAGRWIPAFSGRTRFNINPATGEILGDIPLSDARDIARAVQAARAALAPWQQFPVPRRAQWILAAAARLRQQKETLARLMTQEMGKPLKETRGDVQEAIDMAEYTAGEGRRLFGQTTPSELPYKMALTLRQPVGVCGLITPWNFPMAIPSWKILPAILCGNTVVFKPAEDTPASAARLVAILQDVGLPDGVVNMVHGVGEKAGRALVRHPQVPLISFTGSCEVGREVSTACARRWARCSLEMGGKNAMIVMADADLALAVEAAVWGAFGTTGQRCTATSRLIIHRPIYAKFRRRLLERTRSLRLGDGLSEKTDVGPLIHAAQRRRVHRYVRLGQREGAKLLCGGRLPKSLALRRGFFYEPTIFDRCHPRQRICQEEIFGPVTCLLEARDYAHAVQIHNDVPYGLSSAIFTRDVGLACRAMQDLAAGITYINGSTIGAEVHLPFGGIKQTGNGHREGGPTVFEIFTEWKTVFVDYSGRLQKAQIDRS